MMMSDKWRPALSEATQNFLDNGGTGYSIFMSASRDEAIMYG